MIPWAARRRSACEASSASSRAAIWRWQPSAASTLATAKPVPRDAPVIRAVRFGYLERKIDTRDMIDNSLIDAAARAVN